METWIEGQVLIGDKHYAGKLLVLNDTPVIRINKTPHVVGILLVCTYFIWMMVL